MTNVTALANCVKPATTLVEAGARVGTKAAETALTIFEGAKLPSIVETGAKAGSGLMEFLKKHKPLALAALGISAVALLFGNKKKEETPEAKQVDTQV